MRLTTDQDFELEATFRPTRINRFAIITTTVGETTRATYSKGPHKWPTSLETKQRWLDAWSRSKVASEKFALAESYATTDPEWNIALKTWRANNFEGGTSDGEA